ncbi:MAG: CueP family metal-binding protein [Nocardioides sp.]
MKRLMLAAAVTALIATGCAATDDTATTEPPAAAASATTQGSPAPQAAWALLADYDLQGMDTVEVIDHLDRLGGADRPGDLMASVRPGELQLSAGSEKASLAIPADRFYLSIAPYVDHTHDCFYHSLTTCTGELAGKEVDVRIVDSSTGSVLVDETRTTFANGFTGFWLPRDISGTVEVRYDGLVARSEISTGKDAPTCLTTLHLA